MPSHLACLGFEIKNQTEFSALMQLAAEKSEPLPARKGAYYPWRMGNGVELWAQADKSGGLIGLNPHFSGRTTQVLKLTKKYPSPAGLLDGAFKTWLKTAAAGMEVLSGMEGDYPFVFDCPAFGWFQDLPLPALARVQLAAFPLRLEIVTKGEAAEPLMLGQLEVDEEFFIPVGTFREVKDETPSAISRFGGRVLSSQTVLNPFTRLPFTLATVRTYGMDLDVVIPQNLTDNPLSVGQAIRGEFWISGLIEEVLDTFEPAEVFDQYRSFLQVVVAGTQYQADFDHLSKELKFGEGFRLVREPENPYDWNAIAVYTQAGRKLGYIPRWQNQELAELMDEGMQPRAYLVEIEAEPFTPLTMRVYVSELPPSRE